MGGSAKGIASVKGNRYSWPKDSNTSIFSTRIWVDGEAKFKVESSSRFKIDISRQRRQNVTERYRHNRNRPSYSAPDNADTYLATDN